MNSKKAFISLTEPLSDSSINKIRTSGIRPGYFFFNAVICLPVSIQCSQVGEKKHNNLLPSEISSKYLEYLDSLLFTSEPVISAELCGRSTNISKELDNPVTTSGFIFLVSSIKSLNNVKGKISIPIVNMFLINASRGVIGINSPKQPQLLASPLIT